MNSFISLAIDTIGINKHSVMTSDHLKTLLSLQKPVFLFTQFSTNLIFSHCTLNRKCFARSGLVYSSKKTRFVLEPGTKTLSYCLAITGYLVCTQSTITQRNTCNPILFALIYPLPTQHTMQAGISFHFPSDPK